MAKTKQRYTKQGYELLVNELNYLKNEKREQVKEAIAIARSFGDLSENSEYDEARNEQAKVEARIAELEALIENAEIFDDSNLDTSVVNIGSFVKVFDRQSGEEIEYHIVGSNETDPFENKISVESPVGFALNGKKAGDTVEVCAPSGMITLEIREVSRK